MTIDDANVILSQFLSSPERGEDCFDMDQFYGAMTAILSCPEYISEVDLGFLILGQEGKGEEQWFENEQIRLARVKCLNTLDEALATDTFDLHEHYSQRTQQKKPAENFSRWCQGYLHGYLLTEEAWQDAYEFLATEGLGEVEENHIALLTMLATIADWEAALKENDNPEKLKNNLAHLFDVINENVIRTHQLALILEDNLMQAENVNQPVIRESEKIGRNDPCPCGSGKKYKKCCLQ